MKTLEHIIKNNDLSITTNSRGTDKLEPHYYIKGFYEKEFCGFRDKPIRLLEVGFRHGASLALWSEYFPNGIIYGADNKSDPSITEIDSINEDWINRDNVKIFYGDAYSPTFASKLNCNFNVLIDDGPHTLSSQLKFIKLYCSRLAAPDGIGIIEDLQKFGGLLIWPFLLVTPLRYEVEFYDFRTQSGLSDDMLFVFRNSEKNRLRSRLKLVLRAIIYTLIDPPKILANKYFNRKL